MILVSCESGTDSLDINVENIGIFQNSLCIVHEAREKMRPVITGGDSMIEVILSIEDSTIVKIEGSIQNFV